MNSNIYPRSNDFQTIYLNTVIKNPAIIVGDYTIYNDFVNDPVLLRRTMSYIIIRLIKTA